MAHRNLPSGNIKDHFRNEKRIEPWRSISFGIGHYFFLKSKQTAYSTGKDNTRSVWIDIVFCNSGVFDGLITGYNSQLGKTINLPCLFSVEIGNWIKSLYLTGKLCFEFGSIKECYAVCPRYTSQQTIPVILYGIPNRGDGTKSGDNYSFQFHK